MKRFDVSAARDGFLRAGRAWTVAAQRVAADELSTEQWAQLRADPSITVTEVRPKAPAADDPAGVSAHYRGRLIRLAVAATEPTGKDGKPSVAAIRAATGLKDVSAAERDEHLAAIRAGTDPVPSAWAVPEPAAGG